MADWDEDKCLFLIDAYKDNQVLWDPKDKNYYKKNSKEDAWAQIGVMLSESSVECKQKMINILASFRRERMKRKKSVGTGKEKNKLYVSKWYAYDALNFLNSRNTIHIGADTQNNGSQESKNNLTTAGPQRKKLKPDPKLQLIKDAFCVLKTASNSSKNEQDLELRSYFDFIIEKMKNYSRTTKNSVQNEIFQIIMRADQGSYDSANHCGNLTGNQQSTSVTNTQIRQNVDTTERPRTKRSHDSTFARQNVHAQNVHTFKNKNDKKNLQKFDETRDDTFTDL
ncbi:uncharacterized protein LOC143922619 [Arctopsyche grandis]|uniref:uncharacterized protein LOC143922619 n=1 Tax=Arctopsyche grandis TaxID=121162 RepID=UPI00406D8ADC